MSGAATGSGHTGQGLPPGTRLNDIYEIDSAIASGGMGEIYHARNIHTDDPVAIKFIRSDGPETETTRSLFRKEATALNRLHDKAIVRYYGFAIDPTLGRPYIAMEYVAGRPLGEMIASHGLSLADLCRLGIRVAEGMEAAHREGIIHRDLSPDNILLPEGRVDTAKIIDFGIARETQSAHSIIAGNVAGKYAYMSPEQLGLAGGDVQAASDIYSLGLVLAEASCGHALEMRGSMAEMVARRMQVPDITHLDPHLVPLIGAMLQPNPAARPGSMAQVAHWLRDILDAVTRAHSTPGGTVAITAPPGERSRRPPPPELPSTQVIPPALSGLLSEPGRLAGTGRDARSLRGSAPVRAPGALPAGRAADAASAAIARPGTDQPRKRPPWGLISAGAVLVVVALGGGLAWWLASAPGGSTGGQTDRTEVATVAPGRPAPPAAPAPAPVATPTVPWSAARLDAGGLTALAAAAPGVPAECLLVVPFAVDDWHLSAEGFTADPAPIARLRTAFAGRYGFDPDIRARQIGAAQCPVLDLAGRLAGPPSAGLRLELAGPDVAGPRRLAGAVQAPAGSQIALLAIDRNGMARRLAPGAPLGSSGQVFSLPRPADAVSPDLVVAVASDRPIPGPASDQPEPAADLLARIEQDARSTGARLGMRIALANSP